MYRGGIVDAGVVSDFTVLPLSQRFGDVQMVVQAHHALIRRP